MKPTRLLSFLAVALVALTAPAAAQAATPGVNIAGPPTPQLVNEALSTGAKTVRIFVLWRDFEPNQRGEYPSNDVNLANLSKTYDDGTKALNAAGVQPLFVVTEAPQWANGSTDVNVPPQDPNDYADFLKRFAAHNKALGLQVKGYEIWNEPDESTFWHPGPDVNQYAALLKASYAAAKSADPNAVVVAGPTTGNNYSWYEALYAAGAGGSFDVAGVHTDTGCLVKGPDDFYREADGRIARYSFLGYREVHNVLGAHGDGGKPIWMTELGWSSTNGGPTSCQSGVWVGQKPDGVSEAQQADFLTKAYNCLANDPYVTDALWFTLLDTTQYPKAENNHYGLLRPDGSPKPAFTAFRNIVAAGGGTAGPCGDFDGPSIRVVKPTPNQQFVDKLDLSAAATDTGVGLQRITFTYDGGQQIRNYDLDAAGLKNDVPVGLAPWQNSGKLPLVPHTIEVTATDANGNVSQQVIPVVKVATLAATLKPTIKLKTKKVRCSKKRVCKVAGSLARGVAGSPSIGGKVAVEWQFRNKKGKFRKLVGGLKPANKPFSFKAKLKHKGRWRVRVVYQGQAPWKKTTSKFLQFRVK
jgi:hypothetical protein